MHEDVWHFVGHEVGAEELGLIREVVGRFGGLSRGELAETVCELLAWTRPTGRLKGRECREFLERLEVAREFQSGRRDGPILLEIRCVAGSAGRLGFRCVP